MAKLSFSNDARYKDIARAANRNHEELAQLANSGIYTNMYLFEKEISLNNNIKTHLTIFYDEIETQAQKRMNDVRQVYEKAEEKKLRDGAKELIRRQDLQMRYELATDHELKDMSNEYLTGDASKQEVFELNALIREIRKRDNVNLEGMESKLKTHINQNNITRPWLNDEQYKKAEQELIEVKQVKDRPYIFLEDGAVNIEVDLNNIAKDNQREQMTKSFKGV